MISSNLWVLCCALRYFGVLLLFLVSVSLGDTRPVGVFGGGGGDYSPVNIL